MKKYIILDKENKVLNVISFADDHNENLEKFVFITENADKIVELKDPDAFCAIDGIYHEDIDKVKPPKPFPSWIWDEVEWIWICPIPIPENPNNYRYYWDEENIQWVLVENQES
jgi:hypothetical protein